MLITIPTRQVLFIICSTILFVSLSLLTIEHAFPKSTKRGFLLFSCIFLFTMLYWRIYRLGATLCLLMPPLSLIFMCSIVSLYSIVCIIVSQDIHFLFILPDCIVFGLLYLLTACFSTFRHDFNLRKSFNRNRIVLTLMAFKCSTNYSRAWLGKSISLIQMFSTFILPSILMEKALNDALKCIINLTMSVEGNDDFVLSNLAYNISTMSYRILPKEIFIFENVMLKECIVKMAKQAGSDVTRRWIATIIINVTSSSPKIQQIYGAKDILNVLVKMGKETVDEEAKRLILSSIFNIIHRNEENISLFGTESLRDCLVQICQSNTLNLESTELLIALFQTLTLENEDNQAIFCSENVRNCLVKLSKYYATEEQKVSLLLIYCSLTGHNGTLFGIYEVLTFLLDNLDLEEKNCLVCLVSLLNIINSSEQNKILFLGIDTQFKSLALKLQKLLLSFTNEIENVESYLTVHEIIITLLETMEGKKFYGNIEMKDSLFTLEKKIKSLPHLKTLIQTHISKSIALLTDFQSEGSDSSLFNDEETRNLLISIGMQANSKSPIVRVHLCKSIYNIVFHSTITAKKYYGNEMVRDCLYAFAFEYLTNESVYWIVKAIYAIVDDSFQRVKLFDTPNRNEIFKIFNNTRNLTLETVNQISNLELLFNFMKKDVDSDESQVNTQNTDGKLRSDSTLFCCVCFEVEIPNATINPCGHAQVCFECVKLCSLCPICRREIKEVIRTFL